MKVLLEIVDHWLATVVDLHPFTKKAIYCAKLAESEKDIFVDTLLLILEPKTPHRKFKGVIYVNPQQGEVAELVLALTTRGPLSMLRHYSIDTQTCVRLFGECNQRVNTSMAELVRCAKNSDNELITKLYAGLWHYSMPQNSSSWDIKHLLDCFRFPENLATLANDSPLMFQPVCRLTKMYAGKIKVAGATSLLIGWQRVPLRKDGIMGIRSRHELDHSDQAVSENIKTGRSILVGKWRNR
ncbi:hypothetical protein AB5N19_09571 [Seiridium cardinale]